MEVVLGMRPIFARKLVNNTEIGIGLRNKAGIPKFVIRSLLVSVIKMFMWFWKCVIYLYKKYYMILNLVLGEEIRVESQI